MVGVTLEYRKKGNGKRLVVTTACGLCGTPLRDRQGMADHLPHCPVREIYAEYGALQDGGPDPERVLQAIHADHHESDGTPTVAADGGSLACGECGGPIDPANHKVLIRDRDEIEYLDLCIECQPKYPLGDQFTPATDGGSLTVYDADLAAHDHASWLEAALDYAIRAAQRARHYDRDELTTARLQLAECGVRHAFFTTSLAERELALEDATRHLEAAVDRAEYPAVRHPAVESLQLLVGIQEVDR